MLPKIDTPLYEITLPLSKQKIKFRPFLVKEEKILLKVRNKGHFGCVALCGCLLFLFSILNQSQFVVFEVFLEEG